MDLCLIKGFVALKFLYGTHRLHQIEEKPELKHNKLYKYNIFQVEQGEYTDYG